MGNTHGPTKIPRNSLKFTTLVGQTNLLPPPQHLYSGVVEPRLLSSLKEPSALRPRPLGLEKLRRYYGSVPSGWPIPQDVSCSFPLLLYTRYIAKIGQIDMAEELVTLFQYIKASISTYLKRKTTPELYTQKPQEYEDDAWRHYLRAVSSYSFPRVFSHGPAYMITTHLHSLTGKCPYTEDQILSDVDAWVRPNLPDGTEKHLNSAQVKETLDRLFSIWYRGEANGALDFQSYSNDFIRWGTSGGAKRSKILGETYRTKWAWAYSRSTDKRGHIIEEPNQT